MNHTNTARVSVIISTFNRPDLLKQAVQSVVAQTLAAQEIIIIDDGSEDIYREKIRRINELNPSVVLFQFQENRGVSQARNFALKKAKGDYILFMDDDDLIHPEMLQTGVCHFEKDRTIDVVTCSYDVFFTPDPLSAVYPVSALFKYRELNDHPLRGMFTLDPIDPNELETHPFSAILKASFPIHSCLVKKTSVGKARFPEDLETGEDSYFWLLLARKGCRFRFYPNIYAFYRRHSGNVTRTGRSYAERVVIFLEKVMAEGLPRTRYEDFVIHLRLFRLQAKRAKRASLKHLLQILKCPVYLLRHCFLYWRKTVRAKRALLKLYTG